MSEQFLQNQPLLLLLLAWSLVWKGLALWRAVKLDQKVWYVVILVVNTVGILEIIYLLVTQQKAKKSQTEKRENSSI